MKILLPPKRTCKKMLKIFKTFYEKEKTNENKIKKENREIFIHGLKLFCEFYELSIPKIVFKKRIDKHGALGECTETGVINLLKPNIFYQKKIVIRNNYNYVSLVYHELTHYYLWANPEDKALEGELKLMKKSKRIIKKR